ncbi:MAG: hypothetical protein AB4050_04975 [Synechococcus sp.]
MALVATNLLLKLLPESLGGWIVFLGAPILLGTLQWLVLRRLLPHAWWWIPLMAIGCGLGWVSSGGLLFLMSLVGDTLNWVPYVQGLDYIFMGIVAAGGGLGIGFIQWLYLKRFVQRAAWWLLGSAVALGAGAGFNLIAGFDAAFFSGHNWLLSLSIGGLLGGGIKGATLTWLVQQRR